MTTTCLHPHPPNEISDKFYQPSPDHSHGRGRSFSSSSCSDYQVCRFFVQNKCLRADTCPYSHDLTFIAPEVEQQPASAAQEKDAVIDSSACAICLQSVVAEGRRFGLLPKCNHLFCLDCIVSWRHRGSATRESARRCPVCRISSFFVIPSNRFFISEAKKQRVVDYLSFLSEKPCRYYSESADTELCPYGDMCFFHHRRKSTTQLLDDKVKLVFTDGSVDLYGFRPAT